MCSPNHIPQALQSMGIVAFEALAEADPRRIEIVTGRKYPFGNHIKESLSSLPPKVELKIEESECPRQGKSKIALTLTRLSQSPQSIKRYYADMVCYEFALIPILAVWLQCLLRESFYQSFNQELPLTDCWFGGR